MTPDDLELVRGLAAQEHGLSVVAVAREREGVHASVVNAGVLEHPLGGGPCVGLVARGGSKKLELLRQKGRASVVFRRGWSWASVEGPVTLIGPDDPSEVVAPPAIPGLIRAIFVAAGGTHEDFEEFDRVMAAERRVAVLVSIERVLSNSPRA